MDKKAMVHIHNGMHLLTLAEVTIHSDFGAQENKVCFGFFITLLTA